MARFEAVLKFELDPRQPVTEALEVISVLFTNNPKIEVLEQIEKGIQEMITKVKEDNNV